MFKQLIFIFLFTLVTLFAQEEQSVFGNQVNTNITIAQEQTFNIENVPNTNDDEITQIESDTLSNEIEMAANQEKLTQEELNQITLKEYNNRYFTVLPFEKFDNQPQNIYAKIINQPSNIYNQQRFTLEVEALITTGDFTRIETRFIDEKDIDVINPQNQWQQTRANTYKNLYFFKAYTKDVVLPTLQIIIYNEDEVVDAIFLKPESITYSQIGQNDEQFTNIIARDLKVVSTQTRQYNNNELLTVLELEAQDGNIEEFRLKGYENQLLMQLNEEYPKQNLTYNIILPIYTKELRFNYFNTITNQIAQLIVPIKLEEELVSTQTNLNPNESNIEKYKKIAVGALAVLSLLLYILKRKSIYIFIAIIISIIFFVYVKPNRGLIIDENTNIYILPTNNSTVFFVTPTKQLVEILQKKGEFSKILFSLDDNTNKTVGWVRERDIVED